MLFAIGELALLNVFFFCCLETRADCYSIDEREKRKKGRQRDTAKIENTVCLMRISGSTFLRKKNIPFVKNFAQIEGIPKILSINSVFNLRKLAIIVTRRVKSTTCAGN